MDLKHEIMLEELFKLYDDHIKNVRCKNGKVVITFKKSLDPAKPFCHLIRENFPGSNKLIADHKRLYLM